MLFTNKSGLEFNLVELFELLNSLYLIKYSLLTTKPYITQNSIIIIISLLLLLFKIKKLSYPVLPRLFADDRDVLNLSNGFGLHDVVVVDDGAMCDLLMSS